MILPSRFFCSPMAELTTPALRMVIRRYSQGVVLCSEMLAAGAVAAHAPNNGPLLQKLPGDDPFIYQIVGSNPDVMARACGVLEELGCFAIDINMGCAAPDILKTGGGAGLLAEPERAREVVRACRAAVKGALSVKMRSGFRDSDGDRLVEFGRMLQGEGVDFITLHGRHAKLGFRRGADWGLVKLLKEKLAIPVIGNGDITSARSAVARLRESGCDAVMLGREAVKSPWIFALCERALAGSAGPLTVDVCAVFLDTLRAIESLLPEKLHKSRGHRFAFYYSGNVHFSHELFTRIRKEISIDGMARAAAGYFDRNPGERLKEFKVTTGEGS
jgi:tRNA-dihydrouridine synthase B